jgi:hypothetical protein
VTKKDQLPDHDKIWILIVDRLYKLIRTFARSTGDTLRVLALICGVFIPVYLGGVWSRLADGAELVAAVDIPAGLLSVGGTSGLIAILTTRKVRKNRRKREAARLEAQRLERARLEAERLEQERLEARRQAELDVAAHFATCPECDRPLPHPRTPAARKAPKGDRKSDKGKAGATGKSGTGGKSDAGGTSGAKKPKGKKKTG